MLGGAIRGSAEPGSRSPGSCGITAGCAYRGLAFRRLTANAPRPTPTKVSVAGSGLPRRRPGDSIADLPIRDALSIRHVHTNLNSVKGVGKTTGVDYKVDLLRAQLVGVEVEIKTLLFQIELKRQQEADIKNDIQDSQDYEGRLTFNLNAAGEAYAAILNCVDCNILN